MVTIAIPTYNRLDLLKIMAKSLMVSDLSVPHNIRIYDDCSSEYGIDELERLFPNAASIKNNKKNLRADKNTFSYYVDFLSTSDKYLFSADSDLIFKKNWLTEGIKLIEKTDGILSLFNATSHPVYKILNETFCVKNHIGSAGTLFTRNLIQEIVSFFNKENDTGSYRLEWKWSKFLTDNNIRIFCVNNSLVQHIGISGQNSSFAFDYGKNFIVDSAEQGQIINNIFEQYAENIQIIESKRKNNIKYHIKRIFIIIAKAVFPDKINEKLVKIFN